MIGMMPGMTRSWFQKRRGEIQVKASQLYFIRCENDTENTSMFTFTERYMSYSDSRDFSPFILRSEHESVLVDIDQLEGKATTSYARYMPDPLLHQQT